MTLHTTASGAAGDSSANASNSIRDTVNDFLFRTHGINRHITNLALLKYYDFQGFLVTGQNSGTHWIKWMLSHALAHRYGVEPPRYFNNDSSNDLIGHPKHERIHPHLPRIASSHSIPAYALDWAWLRAIRRPPPYAVVVRDIQDVLISNYEKWRPEYGVPFSRYVPGDPRGKTFVCDVWWYMRFMNRWGEIARRHPQGTLVLRYEDFRKDPLENLRRLARHFRLDLSDADLMAGVAVGSKDYMMARQDPQISERPIRPDGVEGARFSARDREVLAGILDRNLKHDFGYRYFAEPRGFQVPLAPRSEPKRATARATEPVRDAA
jgi:hypothetical protein